jgi:hypothetical protein
VDQVKNKKATGGMEFKIHSFLNTSHGWEKENRINIK